MKLKTRLLILAACFLVFLIAAPAIVFYALGYRLDFATWAITETGGIYVRAVPTGTTVVIDDNASTTTGLFSPSVFVQNLVPGKHTVSITKDGYYSYNKTLAVKQKEVTKLENVTLFQEDMGFTEIATNVAYFSAAPNNINLLTAIKTATGFDITIIDASNLTQKTYTLPAKNAISNVAWSADSQKALVQVGTTYYLVDTASVATIAAPIPYLTGATKAFFNPQNNSEIFYVKGKHIYTSETGSVIIENALAYAAQPGTANIIWLASNGSITTTNTQTLASSLYIAKHVVIKNNSTYGLLINNGSAYLQENGALSLIDKSANTITPVYSQVVNLKTSPDGQKTVYYNAKEVVIEETQASLPVTDATEKLHLIRLFSGNVSDVWWINNDYIAIASGNNVVISEIDARGNVNVITLPYPTPQIFFSQQDKKLYIFSQETLTASENLLP